LGKKFPELISIRSFQSGHLLWDLLIFSEGDEISEQNVKNSIWTDIKRIE